MDPVFEIPAQFSPIRSELIPSLIASSSVGSNSGRSSSALAVHAHWLHLRTRMPSETQQAVITGGTGSLGSAIAKCLQAPGWEVFSPGRVQLDVCDPAVVQAYFQQHAPDLLICAAGAIKDSLIRGTSEADWDDLFAVNFKGAAACARAALPSMVRKRKGHIVFISSHSAIHPPAGQIAYAAAKAALLGLVADLALAHGASNVRINAVLPGFLETRMTSAVSPSRRRKVLEAHALGRFNTVMEVSKFIRYLHHELPNTSGQVFQLDSRAL